MGAGTWDALEADLAEAIFAEGKSARIAVVELCQNHPKAPTHFLILALASAASALESEWLHGNLVDQKRLLAVYRALAAVSADLSELQFLDHPSATCAHMLAHWKRTGDRYFAADT